MVSEIVGPRRAGVVIVPAIRAVRQRINSKVYS